MRKEGPVEGVSLLPAVCHLSITAVTNRAECPAAVFVGEERRAQPGQEGGRE